jgi:dipeptidyl aminopeptidase/acylaminoacyl peptidase
VVCLCAVSVFAQGSKADYERAAGLRKLTENKVFRDRVTPRWLGETSFWYEVRTSADKRENVLVSLESGERTVLAKPPQNSAPAPSLAVNDVPRRSRRTGGETQLNFLNRTAGAVELFWLSTDGERRSYGKIPAGERREQHTFAGHVWLAVDKDGKTVSAFEASEAGGEAEIGGTPGVQPPAGKPAEKREPRNARREPTVPNPWHASIKDFNVVIRNDDTREETALTTDGKEGDAYNGQFFWSPDARWLVAIRTVKGQEHKVAFVESSPKDQLQPKLHSFDYFKPGDMLPRPRPVLFDVAAKKQVAVNDELFPNPFTESGNMDMRWDKDSSRFTFRYNQRGHQVYRIVAVATNGTASAIVDERSKTFIDYSGKFFIEWLDDTGELLWMSERDGWNHLHLYDAKTGRVKNQVTRGDWVVRGVERVDRERRQVWFRAGGIIPGQDPYHVHFARVNFDGSGLTLLTEGDGTHTVEFSPDRRFIIDTYSRVDLPPVTELRRADTGKRVRVLERGDASALLKTGWRAPERFVAKGRDGATDIHGVIVRPTNFDPKKKYPVIENIYAGPQGSFTPKKFSAVSGHLEMAELGFIVVQMDGMGTSHRSKAFHDVCWKNLADAGFQDRIAWIKAAAAKRPEMDLARVGIYGGSAGGQNSLRGMLDHGDFYKVCVSDCGCHDNRMDKIWWNEQWLGWPVDDSYARNSNVTDAHKLRGQLLLVVGELDRNVDPASTMQVASALVKADRDFELLVVPGAGHGSAETPYGKRRRADFFVRHLLGKEPRWQ